MPTRTSVALDDDLREQLAAVARHEGTTVDRLVRRFVDEGLRCTRHPGVVFRPGPTGRRAAIAGGPDVWEVVSALSRSGGTSEDEVAALSGQLGLHERQIHVALGYAAAYPEEIEDRIAANDRALAEVERSDAESDPQV